MERCPTKTFSVAQYDTDPPNVDEIKKHMICVPGTDLKSKSLKELTQGKPASCAYYYIASVSSKLPEIFGGDASFGSLDSTLSVAPLTSGSSLLFFLARNSELIIRLRI